MRDLWVRFIRVRTLPAILFVLPKILDTKQVKKIMMNHFQTLLQNNPFVENFRYIPHYLTQPVRVVKSWRRGDVGADVLAGITVGLIALPQAIAFALIANLPPVMGLYATVVAAIVGALWGSSVQMQTGPANAISILVLSVLIGIAAPGSPEFILAAGLIAVMAGVFQLAIGLVRLGRIVNFVSHSVIVGFASGAAVLIGVNQLRHLLGLNFSSDGLLQTTQQIILHLPNLHWPTTLLGGATIAALLLLRKLNRKIPGPLISLIVASLMTYLLGLNQIGVDVIGQLPTGLPPLVRLPIFDLQLISRLSSGALAIAAIGLIQTTAIARSISNQTGQRVDNNQEFVGQGIANIAMGFFSGYPGAASFSSLGGEFTSRGQNAVERYYCRDIGFNGHASFSALSCLSASSGLGRGFDCHCLWPDRLAGNQAYLARDTRRYAHYDGYIFWYAFFKPTICRDGRHRVFLYPLYFKGQFAPGLYRCAG